MDDREKYEPPSLADLSMKVIILCNLNEKELVHTLEKRVNAIRSLLAGGRYRIKAIFLEVKRLDGSDPTDRDWTWGRGGKPRLKIGSDMKLSFIQHCIHKKEFRMKTPASALYPWYQNFFSGDESMCLESMDEKKMELFFVQEAFHDSSIQTTEWEKKSAKNILRKYTIRFLGNLERNLLMLTEMIYTGEFNTKITSWTADGCAFREKVIFNGKTLPSKRLCL